MNIKLSNIKSPLWKKLGLGFLILSFFFTSCDDFLDKFPESQITEENFYETEEDAISAIIATYDVLQFELSPSGHFRWFWGDIVSDDAIKGGSGDNDVPSLGRLERFEGRPSNDLLSSEWNADYQGIYRANLVLANVPDIDMEESEKQRILGEAKFIRAWFYYNLVILFGDVPLVTGILSPEEANIPRTPKAEVWTQIINDLTDAADVLPKRSELSIQETGRLTKGAAQALLTKAYLWQKNYADAQTTAQSIVSSGEYFLEPDYSQIFTVDGENGAGSVFEIQYMNASNGDWGRAVEGTFTNVFQRARGQFNGFGFNIPTQDFVDEFEEGDPRLNATVFQEGDVMGDRGIFTKEVTGFPHNYYPKKYFNSKFEEAPTGDPNVNGGSNDRVIRYADVLLMLAEAAYHNGDEGTARQRLNEVRARARGQNATILPAVITGGESLLQAIYHERRVELGLEGHRFFDLVRTERVGEVMRGQGLNFTDGVNELFPIPQQQIDLSNGLITQNNGY